MQLRFREFADLIEWLDLRESDLTLSASRRIDAAYCIDNQYRSGAYSPSQPLVVSRSIARCLRSATWAGNAMGSWAGLRTKSYLLFTGLM